MVYGCAMKLDPVVESIRAEMERRDWSVPQLCDEAGVHFTSVYRMFDKDIQAMPNLDTLNKLLKALEMKLVVAR